jgi:hypothetical protein
MLDFTALFNYDKVLVYGIGKTGSSFLQKLYLCDYDKSKVIVFDKPKEETENLYGFTVSKPDFERNTSDNVIVVVALDNQTLTKKNCSSAEMHMSLENGYRTLNRISAPELKNELLGAGFVLVQEYATNSRYVPIPKELLYVYREDVLRTEHLMLLGQKPPQQGIDA